MKTFWVLMIWLGFLAEAGRALAQPTPSQTPRPTEASPGKPRMDLRSLRKNLDPGICKSAKEDPLRGVREKIARYREAFASKGAFEASLEELLERERKEGKDAEDLNWIRAIHPWSLPPTFPSRNSFSNCAGFLQTVSDTWKDTTLSQGAVSSWLECIEVLYPKDQPEEFRAIRKCLSQKGARPSPEAD